MILWPWIIFIVYLSYGIPSLILYIMTFYIIVRHWKEFDSSFFQLYMLDGFMNLLTFFINYIKARFPTLTCHECILAPIYRNIDNFYILEFIMTMNFHMAYVQYAITALIALNRFSIICNYLFFEPIWKKLSWILIVLAYILPFMSSRVVWDYPMRVEYVDETDSYAFTTAMPIDKVFDYLIPFMITTTCVSVFVNVTSIAIVNQMNVQVRQEVEYNFIRIAFITCLVQACGTALSVIRYYNMNTSMAVTLANFIPFISDGLSLVQPWLLVTFSNVMRKKITETVRRNQKTPLVTSVVPIRSAAR
ncbi:Serpentine receptor class gamma [Caenorhabditis elegans]|uniref:Serpentine receptor class gamma n=1 Tax=Caenorhabditis elegans TaxID=6239 RepID=Q22572_CAEEL|nr:Serpentine receptor class gamma [Caenorhabditis elegans]CAA99919.2 Serpentine receptor class gamma [Caenorhabditis elegans]|eukprot:NP_505838.2 Serpentine receptor class gamma [Caenorhabditis elegans]